VPKVLEIVSDDGAHALGYRLMPRVDTGDSGKAAGAPHFAVNLIVVGCILAETPAAEPISGVR
jgi:hypothetical protein